MSPVIGRTAVPSLYLYIVQSIDQLSWSTVVSTGSGVDKTTYSVLQVPSHSLL